MDSLGLVRLPGLMALSRGSTDLVIGLLDGPVALDHPELAGGNVHRFPQTPGACDDPGPGSTSCRHGTFVAGVLAARRGSQAPAIAPDCSLLVRPVFSEVQPVEELPSATPREVADAIVDCVDAGAWVINLSAALVGAAIKAEPALEIALQHSVQRGVLVIAAAGNQRALAGSAITRHPWVIPVVAYSRAGRPTARSSLGHSIGIRGLGAPGEGVTSLAPEGETAVSGGTSVAAPFVTGAAALLWSAFPAASAAQVKHALLSAPSGRRRTVVPPLLDAWGAYEMLSGSRGKRAMS